MPSLSRRILTILGVALLALAITVLAGGIWTGLLIANLALSPSLPWAIIVMALVLWLLWRYLGGEWWPRNTAALRHRSLRANPVSRPVFLWALAAGVLSIVALIGFWIVLFQLVKAPGNALPDFSNYPLLTTALVLLMASLVGAVTEEAGFRGYLQGLLERELGSPAAIVVAALVLAPAHGLTQGFVWTTLLFYLFVDVIFGVTAFLAQSILPGIVVHALGLLVFFSWVWPNDSARRLVSAGGADAWFWIHVAQVVIFAPLAILAFRRLAQVAAPRREASLAPISDH